MLRKFKPPRLRGNNKQTVDGHLCSLPLPTISFDIKATDFELRPQRTGCHSLLRTPESANSGRDDLYYVRVVRMAESEIYVRYMDQSREGRPG